MSIPSVTVLEVGTARTTALVGDAAPDGTVRLLGLGVRETAGMRKGCVQDRDQVADCVAAALLEAGREAGNEKFGNLVLLCSLGDARDDPVSATVDVPDAEDGVVDAAVVAAARQALSEAAVVPASRSSLGHIPAGFSLDGRTDRVLDPLELHARRLTAHGLLFHADDPLVGNLVDAVQLKSGLAVETEYFSALAGASVALSDGQKRDGALYLDFGAGTTSWCGYADGVPVCGGSIPVGGDHVTNDLFMAFRTGSRQVAERLKTESACVALGRVARDRRVPVPAAFGSPDRTASQFAVAQVAEARVRETLELVLRRLAERGLPDRFGAVVLGGGGARLDGLPELVSEVFSAPTFAPAFSSGDRRIDGDPCGFAAAWGGLCAAVVRARRAEAAHRRGIFGRLLGGAAQERE